MNNQQNTSDKTPSLRLHKLYIRKLTFDSPNSPEIFREQQGGEMPRVDLKLNKEHREIEKDHYEVTLKISVSITLSSSEKLLFSLELEHSGLFIIKDIPEEHFKAVLEVDCPTMMFPYSRQIVSQVSVDGGFIPLVLDPVNFLAIYQKSKQQKMN